MFYFNAIMVAFSKVGRKFTVSSVTKFGPVTNPLRYLLRDTRAYIHDYAIHLATRGHTNRVATGQGKVREIQGQGILELVREIWNFVESQGNLWKVGEI